MRDILILALIVAVYFLYRSLKEKQSTIENMKRRNQYLDEEVKKGTYEYSEVRQYPRENTFETSVNSVDSIYKDPIKRSEAITESTLARKPLMNWGEFYALKFINDIIDNKKLPLIAYPQIPLKAFITQEKQCVDEDSVCGGFYVDIALMNKDNNVVAVVEINGGLHDSVNDMNKNAILEKIMIPCIFIQTDDYDKSQGVIYSQFMKKRVVEATNDFFDHYK